MARHVLNNYGKYPNGIAGVVANEVINSLF
jgi:hypothetical protein